MEENKSNANNNVQNQPLDENEKKNLEQERADENNANVVSNAADVAIATKNPYAVAAGLIIKAGDAQTDGHMSRTLGKATTVINKNVDSTGKTQDKLNKLSESGMADKIGTAASFAGGAKGGGGAAKAASEASQAANIANDAAKAQKAVEATGNASKIEEAKNAADNAKKAADNAKKNAEDIQKKEIEKRNDVKNKTHNDTKIVKSTDKKNPYDTARPKEDRNVKEIIDDKVEEKENKPENDTSDLLKNKQLDTALDVVDVAIDVVDSAASKTKKIILLIVFGPIIFIFLAFLFLFLSLGSMFGADVSPGPASTKEETEGDPDDFNTIVYKYTKNLSIETNEEELIEGIVFYELRNDIETYKNENINMETIYNVYGVIYTLNAYNKATFENNKHYISNDDIIYCHLDGCYKINIDDKDVYVDDNSKGENEVIDTINSLNIEDKNELISKVSEGIFLGELIKDNNKKYIEVDDNLKSKIKDYAKDGKTYDEILTKIGINTKSEELE